MAPQNPNAGASAFISLVLTVAFMGLAWLGLHTLLRRLLGRERIALLDRILYFLFALGFNAAVLYLSVSLCTAGLAQFLSGIGFVPRVLSYLLELVTGVPGQMGLKPYEILGLMIGAFSMVIAHLLYRATVDLYVWLESGLLLSLSANRMRIQQRIEQEQPDLDFEDAARQADGRARRYVAWQTFQSSAAVLFWLVLFIVVVYGFDVLLLQIQLADMMGLAQGEGGNVPQVKDIPSIRDMLARYGTTAAGLVLKGLTWFYIGLLLCAAYLFHVSYHGVMDLLHPEEPVAEETIAGPDEASPPVVPPAVPPPDEQPIGGLSGGYED